MIFGQSSSATIITLPKTWANGDVLTAADLNNNLTTISQDYNGSITPANFSATMTATSSQFYDYSAINTTSTTLGIRLPTGTSGTAAGQIAYDSTQTQIRIGDGTAANLVPSFPSAAQGDVIYFNGSKWVRLAAGTSGLSLLTKGASANPVFGRGGFLSFGDSSSQTVTFYCAPANCNTTEANVRIYRPHASVTFSGLSCGVQAAPGGAATWTITARKSTVNQTLTCTITGSAGRCADTTNSFTATTSDDIDVGFVAGGGPAASGGQYCSMYMNE